GLIQVVGTDHCPFMWEQKKMGKDDFSKIPNGHPGIEHRMELLFSEGVHQGKISVTKYVEVSSTNAAKIFGMYPRKGTIAIGSDADIVIFNPKKEHIISVETHHMNCDYSGYEGQKVTGKTEVVILRGKVAIENEERKLSTGHGQFIPRGKTSKTVI
ncbi:MAG: amidohydrolase family protein, partial [Flavobacteriaceae bacterium]|nr:amidohydrolase family protein [Flavobacteriaceae bacterium]